MRAVGLSVPRIDEHQVDVGAIVQLAPAQLSERNHRQATLAVVLAAGNSMTPDQLSADAVIAQIENCIRQIREFFRNLGKRAEAQYIAQHNAQDLLAAK